MKKHLLGKEACTLKVERLLAIIMMLLSKRRVSAPQLAQHFEVSLRTIYRDLEAINTSGIPIVAYPGSQGGFEILENFTIDRQILSLEEWTAVVAALKGALSSADDSQIGLLLDKIKALYIRCVYDQNGPRSGSCYGSMGESMGVVPAARQQTNVQRRF
jgi:hypothetical protein